MVHTIEACRQIQVAIDIETVSRAEIETRYRQFEKSHTSIQEEINDSRTEINLSQLRNVEILGVFLAAVAMVVTSVRGIEFEGDHLVRIVIWLGGYGSLVSLFWLLHYIVKLNQQDSAGVGLLRVIWRAILGRGQDRNAGKTATKSTAQDSVESSEGAPDGEPT